MPVFGTPIEWVKMAVKSIRNQSARKFTLVIVDDNNPPGELRDFIYEQAVCKCRTVVVRTDANRGLAAALNAGLDACTGDIVIRMDSDDLARKHLVRDHIDYFSRHRDRHICGVQISMFDTLRTRVTDHPPVVTRSIACNMSGYWFVNHPGIAFRRRTVMELGGYGETPAALAEDYALWVKFLNAGYTIYNQKDVRVDYRVADNHLKKLQDRRGEHWMQFLHEQKMTLR